MNQQIISLDRQKLYINNQFLDILKQKDLLTFNSIFNIKDVNIAKKYLNYRYTIKVNIIINNITYSFFLKKYLNFRHIKASTEASQEWYAMWDFLNNNIPAPIPVALGVDKDKAFVMSKAVNYTSKLSDWIAKNKTIKTIKKGIIKDIANIVGKMHQLKLYHQDLYLCHFLCSSEKKAIPLTIIDLQRVKKDPLFKLKWQIKDLAQLFFSSKNFLTKEDIEYFWTNYKNISKTRIPKHLIFLIVYLKSLQIERHTKKHNL